MEYKKILIIALFLVICLPATAFSDEIRIKAEVDRVSITTDEDITYKLIISSATLRNLPEPEFPEFENFYVLSSAQTSQISLGKGELKTLLIYVFVLQPKQTGELEIGPSKIVLNKKEYLSQQFKIEVKQGTRELPPESEIPQEEELQFETGQIIL